MTFKETMAKLFSTSEGTYYKWKKENRPIIKLLEKYLERSEIEEFLETGKIIKFERKEIYDDYFNEMINNIIKIIYKFDVHHKFLSIILSTESNFVNLIQFETKYISLYNENKLSKFELIDLIKYKFPMDVYKFIKLHKKDNFEILEISLKDGYQWLVNYLRLLKYSQENNFYDKLFGNDGPRLESFVPCPPDEDNYHSEYEEDSLIYNKILIFIENCLRNNDLKLIDELGEYDRRIQFSVYNKIFDSLTFQVS